MVFCLMPTTVRAQETELEGLPDDVQEATVSGWVDGDKFKVEVAGEEDEQEVLMIGTDAPEIGNGDDDLGECYAQEAADALKKLLKKGLVVYLEQDEKDRDGKDRLLRYVWTADKDGRKAFMVNTKMIRDGFASFQTKEDLTRRDKAMKKAEDQAKENNRGLWAACSGPHAEITPVPQLGSGDNPAPIGTALEADGRRITINNAYFLDSYGFFTPQQNFVFLVINVTMENISESGKTHPYNELCFAGKDLDAGADYDDSFLNPSDIPLGAGDMLPGDVVSGEVVLEVHQNSTNIRVKYSTGGFGCSGGKSVYWIVQR